jgi:hypothetical protein
LVFDKQVKVMKYDQLAARDAPWLKNDTGPVDGVIGIGPNSSFLRELLKEGLANTNESNGMHSVTLWVGKRSV